MAAPDPTVVITRRNVPAGPGPARSHLVTPCLTLFLRPLLTIVAERHMASRAAALAPLHTAHANAASNIGPSPKACYVLEPFLAALNSSCGAGLARPVTACTCCRLAPMRHDNCLPASLPSVGSDLGQILRTIQNVHLLLAPLIQPMPSDSACLLLAAPPGRC